MNGVCQNSERSKDMLMASWYLKKRFTVSLLGASSAGSAGGCQLLLLVELVVLVVLSLLVVLVVLVAANCFCW